MRPKGSTEAVSPGLVIAPDRFTIGGVKCLVETGSRVEGWGRGDTLNLAASGCGLTQLMEKYRPDGF